MQARLGGVGRVPPKQKSWLCRCLPALSLREDPREVSPEPPETSAGKHYPKIKMWLQTGRGTTVMVLSARQLQ